MIGNTHLQLVAYKINLFYSTDAVNWSFDVTSPWRAGWVGDGLNSTSAPSDWWDYDRQAWVTDSFTWNMNLTGYYRAAIEFYWFADDMSASGYDYLWADHFDYSAPSMAAQIYCAV
ncbi:MAG: hypothetical protein ABI725_07040 [Chloroflexota bacterium]